MEGRFLRLLDWVVAWGPRGWRPMLVIMFRYGAPAVLLLAAYKISNHPAQAEADDAERRRLIPPRRSVSVWSLGAATVRSMNVPEGLAQLQRRHVAKILVFLAATSALSSFACPAWWKLCAIAAAAAILHVHE